MKKLVLISLLLLLFFNQIGFQLLYWVEQIIIKKEQKELMISLLPDYDFEKIEDNEKIQWEEEGKEFRYNKQMYDVARTIMVKGKKVYLVINDAKENKLLQKMEHTVSKLKENNNTKGSHTPIFKYIQSIFIINNASTLILFNIKKGKFLIYNESFTSDTLDDILIPPPQSC
ncbi:MAG: hypothetical protein ACO29O_03745 [Chitinophagaceae bacterium]